MGSYVAILEDATPLVVDTALVGRNKEILTQRYQIIDDEPVKPNGKPLLVAFPFAQPGDNIIVRRTKDRSGMVVYSCGAGKVSGLVISVGTLGQTIKVIPLVTEVRRDKNCLRNLLLSIMFDAHNELSRRAKRVATKVLLEITRGPGCMIQFIHATLGKIKLFLDYQLNTVVVFTRRQQRRIPFDSVYNLTW